MLDEVTKDEIFSIIERAVEDLNFFEYKTDMVVLRNYIIFQKCDLVVRVNIVGTDQNGHNLFIDLLIKLSDKSKSKNTPITKGYHREMFIYKNVFSKIRKFVRSKAIPLCQLDIMPIFYKMFSTEDREVLIFNDLKEQGYKKHTGELSASHSMTYRVMNCLAKFHATSIAFRLQQPAEFNDLIHQWQPDIKQMFLHPSIEEKFSVTLEIVKDILIEENRVELLQQFENDIGKGALDIIQRVLSDIPEDFVIIHGDARMHNIMSKYEKCLSNDDVDYFLIHRFAKTVAHIHCVQFVNGQTLTLFKTHPGGYKKTRINRQMEQVKFVYWQLATTHSPVLDIAYFLYFTYTPETIDNFENYIEYYYKEICEHLKKHDIDAQKVFPFTRLLEHFLSYSIYPLVMALCGIPLIMINNYLVANNCINEKCELGKNCEFDHIFTDYGSLSYASLKDDLRHDIREKVLGILELHYKYFCK